MCKLNSYPEMWSNELYKDLIKYYWIKQWNGELPSTVLGESMSYMVDLGLSNEEVK